MILNVVDNFISKDLLECMNYSFNNSPHYIHMSVNDFTGSCFYNIPLELNNPFVWFYFNKLNDLFLKNNYQPLRAYVNIQHKYMDGEFHTDDGDLTCLLMLSKTLQKEEGVFEIENGEKIDFVQNRLILFDAKNYHRGIGPRTNVTRMTFALKTKKI
jgi:hypothetical protein